MQKVLLAAFGPQDMSSGLIWGEQYCVQANSGGCNIWRAAWKVLLTAFGPLDTSGGLMWGLAVL